jgi:ankyrin repeat protein
MTLLPATILALLLAANTDIDLRLLAATHSGNTAAVKSLLQRGANAEARDNDGTTALMSAALYGDLDMMGVLVRNGADINARNKAGATALMWSAADPQKVKWLLKHGADVNTRADTGFTPLLVAAGCEGSLESVKLLLDHGATVNEASNGGFTPLMAACGGDSSEAVALLLRKGADVRAKNRVGWTALHSAATSGKADRVRMLLDHGADANAVEKSQGRTPLLWAAASGCAEAVNLLLEHGANADLQSVFGKDTALMRAAARGPGDTAAVKALLAKSTAPLARDKDGLTSLDWALARGDESTAALIRAAGKADVPTKTALPALKLAGEANTVAAALARSIPLLERASPAFAAASGEHCVSCHHQSLPAMALGLARERGRKTDAKLAHEQAAETLEMLAPRRELYLQGIGVTDHQDPGYWLAGLAAAGQPADATTDALVHYLITKQSADGRWRASQHRPPMVGSDFATTALSLRALQHFGPPARAAEIQRRVGRARDWLHSDLPQTTEDRVFQLLGLAWSKADAGSLHKSAGSLRAMQRQDGGWSQLPGLASDAYATGQVLYALHEADGLAASDPAYQKGIKNLLLTQCADGSWFVPTRSMPVQPYFESGFPHGRSQFISVAATCWATMAITLSTDH